MPPDLSPIMDIKLAELPWRQMIGMRHRLIHGYDAINWDRVWETVIDDLPRVSSLLAPLIPQED